METVRWSAIYTITRSGKRAERLMEPCKDTWGDFDTEEEAIEYFKKKLKKHVEMYKQELRSYSNMSTLIKRLRKYDMHEEADEIERITQMLKTIDG